MTDEQWRDLQVGDVIIDHLCSGARRKVLAISRVSGTRGMRAGAVRTSITVANIKSKGLTTTLFSTCDSPNKARFELVREESGEEERGIGDDECTCSHPRKDREDRAGRACEWCGRLVRLR